MAKIEFRYNIMIIIALIGFFVVNAVQFRQYEAQIMAATNVLIATTFLFNIIVVGYVHGN